LPFISDFYIPGQSASTWHVKKIKHLSSLARRSQDTMHASDLEVDIASWKKCQNPGISGVWHFIQIHKILLPSAPN
jgi:hypothetical protein